MRSSLFELEKTGLYVFHGTDNGEIYEFEPRQAMSHGKPDGQPSVFASEFVEPALFMAIIGSRKTGGWNANGEVFGFYVNDATWKLSHKEKWSGFVYVFKKELFTKDEGWTYRSTKLVKPIKVFNVTIEDLPKEITITQ